MKRCLLVLLFTTGCAPRDDGAAGVRTSHPPQEPVSMDYGDPIYLGDVARPHLDEISGMAHSRRRGDLLWLVDDQSRDLFAVSHRGADLGALRVLDAAGARVENRDFEDLAAFQLPGGATPRAYLAIADTGGSGGRYRQRLRGPKKKDSRVFEVHVVPEPELPPSASPADGASVQVEWSVRFVVPKADYAEYREAERSGEANTWEGEALAVDAVGGTLLLMSKPVRGGIPARLWSAPLRTQDAVVYLQKLADVRTLPRIPSAQQPKSADDPPRGDVPTALDLYRPRGAADGAVEMFVQTDRHAYRFCRRSAGEDWSATLGRRPQPIRLPPMRQPEALAIDPASGDLFVTSEQDGAPSPIFCARRSP